MMEKKKGICTVCGRLEELKGIMCESCTDKINKEARGMRLKEKKEARKEIKRQGIPDKDE